MVDDLLDAFDRKKKDGTRRGASGGLLGKIGRLLEGEDEPEERRHDDRRYGTQERRGRDDDRGPDAQSRPGFGFGEDDDDRGGYSGRKRRDFDFDLGD